MTLVRDPSQPIDSQFSSSIDAIRTIHHRDIIKRDPSFVVDHRVQKKREKIDWDLLISLALREVNFPPELMDRCDGVYCHRCP